MPTADHLEEVQ